MRFTTLIGAIAQLGERLPCTQEVSGSIPLSSTINEPALIQLQNAFTECIAKLLLFNNPEQAENLKRRVVFILRNKNEIYDAFESLKCLQSAALQNACGL